MADRHPTAAVARMAGALAWRPEVRGFVAGAGDEWTATADGRRLILCSGESG